MWQGKVVRKADFVDPTTQSVSVFITLFSSPSQPLYEGQYLRARFTGGVVENAMEIPRNAVFNANQVFTVNDGKLNKRVIEIHKVGNESLIFSGLEEGTVVVTEPLVNAREGSLVQVKEN
jgi:multidrug efflux pump subunit AcrA (membrane-fusion protein)